MGKCVHSDAKITSFPLLSYLIFTVIKSSSPAYSELTASLNYELKVKPINYLIIGLS